MDIYMIDISSISPQEAEKLQKEIDGWSHFTDRNDSDPTDHTHIRIFWTDSRHPSQFVKLPPGLHYELVPSD